MQNVNITRMRVSMNFVTFAANYKVTNGKLVKQSKNVVSRIFLSYSPNPNGVNYGLYCKYQLLKYKPWKDSQMNAWNKEPSKKEPSDDCSDIDAWRAFLHSSFAKQHVPEWDKKLHDSLNNCSKSSEDNKTLQINKTTQEEWMIISDLYNSYNTFASENIEQIPYDWRVESSRYTKKTTRRNA